MNYNPLLYQLPAKTGLFSSLFGGMSFSSIIGNASKTLGVINQAIPIVKQASPVIKNARTMFKVMNEFKKTDTPKIVGEEKIAAQRPNTTEVKTVVEEKYNEVNFDGGPVFFV